MPPSRTPSRDAALFGELVTRLRLQHGWTLEALAQESGMSSRHLGVLERGGNMATLPTIVTLARTFGMSASDLVREFEQLRDAAG